MLGEAYTLSIAYKSPVVSEKAEECTLRNKKRCYKPKLLRLLKVQEWIKSMLSSWYGTVKL